MTTPQTIMPLEEVVLRLRALETQTFREMEQYQMNDSYSADSVDVRNCRFRMQCYGAALHHLEAGKRECQCEEMQRQLSVEEAIWVDDGSHVKCGIGNPSIQFCPWCGGRLSTTPTEEVQP